MLSELATKLCLDLLELNGRESSSRPAVNFRLVTDDFATKRFREPANRLSKVSLEELDNRGREIKLVCAVNDVLLRETVLDHPLREVTDDLRRGCDLRNGTVIEP